MLHISAANLRMESCVPIGLEAEWRPGPVWMLRSKKRFACYVKINCMYAFLMCRLKNIPMLYKHIGQDGCAV